MLEASVLSIRDCNLEFTGHMFVLPTNNDAPLITMISHDQDGQHCKKDEAGNKNRGGNACDYLINDTKFSLLLIEEQMDSALSQLTLVDQVLRCFESIINSQVH